MGDPLLELFDSSSTTTPINTNDNWDDQSNATTISVTAVAVGAFALPAGSNDAALLLTLEPSVYTVQLSNQQPGNGQIGLLEIY